MHVTHAAQEANERKQRTAYCGRATFSWDQRDVAHMVGVLPEIGMSFVGRRDQVAKEGC